MKIRQLPNSIILAALLLAPIQAFGWGAEGHEVVAGVAFREMTPAARRQVAGLLGSETMLVEQSNWADEIKDQRRDTALWHFVNIPLHAPAFVSQRDCAAGDCVVAQIEADVQTLRNRKLDANARAQALMFLIHFVADVHQPLHVEDNDDRGGNEVRVQVGRERANLHRVWDADIVKALGFDPDRVAADIERSITPAQRAAWTRGTAADWANEAHAIARDQVYPPLGRARYLRLPRDYAWREAPVARMQLARAGVRLAWLLNAILK
ncbi:MAG TPA: S1/P1 nuclease [Rhizomicrobium sp.]|nr:S1/P1 nuclease [Rhizomicrobium sp.]